MAIHPDQIAAINDVFSPSPTEIASAQRLLKQAVEYRDIGSEVFTMEGRMVDAPMIRAAEQLLEKAGLYGLLED